MKLPTEADNPNEARKDNELNCYQFDGTFELAFLRNHEVVRSAGKDTHAIEIVVHKTGEVLARAELMDWVIRTSNGQIAVQTPCTLSSDCPCRCCQEVFKGDVKYPTGVPK